MKQKIVIAGFGGQGVMLLGQLLTYAGMLDGLQVTWFPSYGPEMRGGTANCSIIISNSEIGSPIVDRANVSIIMNQPSLEKFVSKVKAGGIILTNNLHLSNFPGLEKIKHISIPANDIANSLGNVKAANMVMLGAYQWLKGVISEETILKTMKTMLAGKGEKILELNIKAFRAGKEFVSKLGMIND